MIIILKRRNSPTYTSLSSQGIFVIPRILQLMIIAPRSTCPLLRRTLRLVHHATSPSRAMSQARRQPKRFAPLDPQRSNEAGAPPLKGIVFDVDGTLWYVSFMSCQLCCIICFFLGWKYIGTWSQRTIVAKAASAILHSI